MVQYELMLDGGRRAIWDGEDGEDASRRYAAAHPGRTVFAWRNHRPAMVIPEDARSLRDRIIEPGHPAWGRQRKDAA